MVTTRGSNFDANTCCRRVSIQCKSTNSDKWREEINGGQEVGERTVVIDGSGSIVLVRRRTLTGHEKTVEYFLHTSHSITLSPTWNMFRSNPPYRLRSCPYYH